MLANKIETPSGIALSNLTTDSITFTVYDKSDASYNKYLKLIKNGKVIAVGDKHTGEVDLTGLPQRHLVKNHEYALSYDVDNKMRLSEDALTPIFVNKFYTLGTPEAPVLTLTSIEAGIKYEFNKPKDWGRPITGYTLRYAVTGSGDWQIKTLASNATGGTLSNLTEDVEYKFTIQAKNEIGQGDMSKEYSIYPTPSAPTGLKATPTEDGATISATKKSGNYLLRIYDGDKVVASGATSAVITKLESDLTVKSGKYQATWYNQKGKTESAPVDVPGFTTLLHKPGFPIMTLTPMSNQVQYKLTLPSDDGARGNGKQDIIYYTVMYHKTGETWQTLRTNSPTSKLVSSGNVSGLEPDTEYEFRATSSNSRLTSDFGPVVKTTTLLGIPDAPTIDYNYGEATTSAIKVYITPGKSDGAPNNGKNDVTFQVSTKTPNGSWGKWSNVSGTSPTITGLAQATKYSIRMRAKNKDEVSSASNTIVVATRADAIKLASPRPILHLTGSSNARNLIADVNFNNDIGTAWRNGKKVNGAYTSMDDGVKRPVWEFKGTGNWSVAHGGKSHSRFRVDIKKGDVARWRFKAKVISGGRKAGSFVVGPEAYETPNGSRTEYVPNTKEYDKVNVQTSWTRVTGEYTFKKDHNYVDLVMRSTNKAPKVRMQIAEPEFYINEPLPSKYRVNNDGYNHSVETKVFEASAQEHVSSKTSAGLGWVQKGTPSSTTGANEASVTVDKDPNPNAGANDFLVRGVNGGQVTLTFFDKNYPENYRDVDIRVSNLNGISVMDRAVRTGQVIPMKYEDIFADNPFGKQPKLDISMEHISINKVVWNKNLTRYLLVGRNPGTAYIQYYTQAKSDFGETFGGRQTNYVPKEGDMVYQSMAPSSTSGWNDDVSIGTPTVYYGGLKTYRVQNDTTGHKYATSDIFKIQKNTDYKVTAKFTTDGNVSSGTFHVFGRDPNVSGNPTNYVALVANRKFGTGVEEFVATFNSGGITDAKLRVTNNGSVKSGTSSAIYFTEIKVEKVNNNHNYLGYDTFSRQWQPILSDSGHFEVQEPTGGTSSSIYHIWNDNVKDTPHTFIRANKYNGYFFVQKGGHYTFSIKAKMYSKGNDKDKAKLMINWDGLDINNSPVLTTELTNSFKTYSVSFVAPKTEWLSNFSIYNYDDTFPDASWYIADPRLVQDIPSDNKLPDSFNDTTKWDMSNQFDKAVSKSSYDSSTKMTSYTFKGIQGQYEGLEHVITGLEPEAEYYIEATWDKTNALSPFDKVHPYLPGLISSSSQKNSLNGTIGSDVGVIHMDMQKGASVGSTRFIVPKGTNKVYLTFNFGMITDNKTAEFKLGKFKLTKIRDAKPADITTTSTTTTSTTSTTTTSTTSTTTTTKKPTESDVPVLSMTVKGKDIQFDFQFPKQAKKVLRYNLNIAGEDVDYAKSFQVEASKTDDKASGSITVEKFESGIYDINFSALSLDGTKLWDGYSNIVRVK